MKKFLFAAVLLFFCSSTFAQQALDNDAVLKLKSAGLSDDLIISTINGAQTVNFNTSPDSIIALKNAGLSEKVIGAIVSHTPAVAASPATPSAPPPFHSTDGKLRIYVTDHPMFESNGMAQAAGNRHGGSAAAVSHTQSGDDPRTVEVQADIRKVCPANIIASNNPDRADYVLVFRRRGGERSAFFAMGGLTGLALSAMAKVDGASLFENTGDMLYATKQNTVEKAIKDICDHIPNNGAAPAGAPAQK